MPTKKPERFTPSRQLSIQKTDVETALKRGEQRRTPTPKQPKIFNRTKILIRHEISKCINQEKGEVMPRRCKVSGHFYWVASPTATSKFTATRYVSPPYFSSSIFARLSEIRPMTASCTTFLTRLYSFLSKSFRTGKIP